MSDLPKKKTTTPPGIKATAVKQVFSTASRQKKTAAKALVYPDKQHKLSTAAARPKKKTATVAIPKTIDYPGAKHGEASYKNIINQFPPHNVFISGFLGTCGVMAHKRPAERNIGIELNPEPIRKYWLKHPRKPQIFVASFFQLIKIPAEAVFFLTQSAQTLLYLDPPYLFDTRRSKKPLYKFELTEEQHLELIAWAKQAKCMVAISHYPCAMYDELLNHGWRKITWKVGIHGAQVATEALYMNYPEPKALHQYDYLGKDKIERQRIKRMGNNLIGKLKRLPPWSATPLLNDLKTTSLTLALPKNTYKTVTHLKL